MASSKQQSQNLVLWGEPRVPPGSEPHTPRCEVRLPMRTFNLRFCTASALSPEPPCDPSEPPPFLSLLSSLNTERERAAKKRPKLAVWRCLGEGVPRPQRPQSTLCRFHPTFQQGRQLVSDRHTDASGALVPASPRSQI